MGEGLSFLKCRELIWVYLVRIDFVHQGRPNVKFQDIKDAFRLLSGVVRVVNLVACRTFADRRRFSFMAIGRSGGGLSKNRGLIENRPLVTFPRLPYRSIPPQTMGVDTWSVSPVESLSVPTVLAETSRFKATQRSLSLFKWGLIAQALMVAACM